MAYGFKLDETLAEAVARTAREQLRDARGALTGELASDPAAAVHRARKAIKKERALLRLVRGGIAPKRRRRENEALRTAAGRLSGSRDAEVMLATLNDLAERYTGQVPRAAFDAVRDRLEARRRAVHAAADDTAAAAQAAAALAAVQERMAGWVLHPDTWRALAPGIDRTYRHGIAAMRRAQAHPDAEHLHAWRKRAKDHWYQLRLLAPACGAAVRGAAAEASLLCDLLGADHDLAVLRQTLRAISHDVAADLDAIVGLLDHRRAQLQAQAWLAGARVYAETPQAFRRRMRRYWDAGRAERRAAERRAPAALAEATRPALA
jgi:CHAD domain-containing protein